MDASELRDAVEAETATELERLGADKVLLAATGADLSTPAVVTALDAALARQQRALEDWADAASDDDLAATFEDVAADVATAREPFADDVRDDADVEVLLDLGDPAGDYSRAGAGLVAAPLVVDRLALQGVSFFVNEADTAGADRCRALRTAMEDLRSHTDPALEGACTSDGAWERVEAGATGAIAASYQRYASVLEGMGLDPKPVC
jgi:hypothetical protein